MIMIIDAGATSTKVCLIEDQKIGPIEYFPGINPNYNSDQDIKLTLAKIHESSNNLTSVFYYGTGCASDKVQARMKDLISEVFAVSNISVHSDLLASARASAKSNPGQVNILGTGSASCLYDGDNIQIIYPNYGYLFGDYGSGYRIGKQLLETYFYGKFDKEATHKIEVFSQKKKIELLRDIYKDNTKEKVASFAECALQLRKNDEVQNILHYQFDAFITQQIMHNPDYTDTNQYFTGSIAHFFEEDLKICLSKYGLKASAICQSPIEELSTFHLTYRQ